MLKATSYGADDKRVERGTVPGGYSYTRTTLQDAQGRVIAEQWVVHGAVTPGSGRS
jgi:hypothetical protein